MARSSTKFTKIKFSEKFIYELLDLANWCSKVEPWHWWSIYGKVDEEYPNGISATELCTEEIAREFLPMAEKSFELAQKFIKNWFDLKPYLRPILVIICI